MGVARKIVILALVVFTAVWWTGRAAATTSVGNTETPGEFFVSLSGADASSVPTIRNASSGQPIGKTTIRSDANGTLYRVGPCFSGSMEITTPASYLVHSCTSPATAAQLASLRVAVAALDARVQAMETSILRLNASTARLQGGVTDLKAESGAQDANVSTLSTALASLKRDVAGLAVPKDLALGSDLEATETMLADKIDAARRGIPVYVYALVALQFLTLGLAGFPYVRRAPGPKDFGSPGVPGVAAVDPLAQKVREALLNPQPTVAPSEPAVTAAPAVVPPPVPDLPSPQPSSNPFPQPLIVATA